MSWHWCGILAFVIAISGSMSGGSIANDSPGTVGIADPTGSLLIGVGLVIGLPGTGDTDVDDMFVDSSIVGVVRRAGLDLWRGQIKPGQIAKVMVTAELTVDATDGKRLTVSVTAIGDASSLAGGTLLVTPLRDEGGRVYAVGQGRVEVGNQVADAELSRQPESARIGRLAEGAVLNTDHAPGGAFD